MHMQKGLPIIIFLASTCLCLAMPPLDNPSAAQSNIVQGNQNQPNDEQTQAIRDNMQRWRQAILTSSNDTLLRQNLSQRIIILNNRPADQNQAER